MSLAAPGRNPLIRPLRAVATEPTKPALEPAADLAASARRPEVRPPSGDTSLELLDRASKGMTFIVSRYKHLEDHIKQLDAWSNAQIQAAEEAAERWKEAAAATERKLEDVQRTMDMMARRVEASEQTMQRDKEALTILQDRIIAAFGFGSEAHDALNATLDLP